LRLIRPSSQQPKSRDLVLVLVALSLVLTACISARRTPNLEQIFASARTRTGKRPVIVIPGILGTELINPKTGKIVWPSAFRTDEDVLPIGPDLATNRDDLVPGRILETVRLARILPEVYVYRDLLDALRRYAGYREATWEDPGSNGDRDVFYVFAYDWRLDNVTNARKLIQSIERLKQRLQRPDLKFNIVAHSMGGLIARYAAMYGDADLPPDGVTLHPTWPGAAHISKIVMIGTPNEGTSDAFATLVEGYSITEGLRRRVPLLNKLSAGDAARTPSVFQLMPHRQSSRFLDENLQPVDVDLYDPENWKRYGWGALTSAEFRRRHNGSLEDLEAYLANTLKRARRFHDALDAVESSESPVILLAIGGDCEETLNAPVILRDEKSNRWLTLVRPREYRTSAGVKMSKEKVTDAMYAPGDGRVTRASLLGENLIKSRDRITGFTLLRYAVFGCDLHGQLPRNKTLQDNALTAIVNEAMN
jgi:pimeloyl-ACP methyl ester carboxylesterase